MSKSSMAFTKRIHLEEMTLSALDNELEQMYLNHRADPEYLFMDVQDRTDFEADVQKHVVTSHGGDSLSKLSCYVNQTTGKIIHMVTLPELEHGTIMLGFFDA